MSVVVTGLFDSHTEAKQALTALERAGISSQDISLISNAVENDPDLNGTDTAMQGAGTGAGIGGVVGGLAFLLAGLGIIAIPGLGPVVASGWLVSALTGAISGAVLGAAIGGVMGAFRAEGVRPDNMEAYGDHLKRGGALLCVRAEEGAQAQRVNRIIASHQTAAPVTRRDVADEEGWEGFDPSSRLANRERTASGRGRH